VSDTQIIRSVDTDRYARPKEIAAIEAAFRDAGFNVRVNANREVRTAGGLVPWVVAVSLATPITAFFTALGTQAGKDAYPVLKTWVTAIWKARRSSDGGSIDLEDPDGTRLILDDRIPDRAVDALAEVDWDAKRGHYLVWDDDRDEWLDPTMPDRDAT
jgi:hypothetical protein